MRKSRAATGVAVDARCSPSRACAEQSGALDVTQCVECDHAFFTSQAAAGNRCRNCDRTGKLFFPVCDVDSVKALKVLAILKCSGNEIKSVRTGIEVAGVHVCRREQGLIEVLASSGVVVMLGQDAGKSLGYTRRHVSKYEEECQRDWRTQTNYTLLRRLTISI